MTIVEALKETGMAHFLASELYVLLDIGRTLSWRYKSNNTYYHPFIAYEPDMFSTDWQPYHIEKSKCRACQEASQVQTRDGKKVRNICWDFKGGWGDICGVVLTSSGYEIICTWSKEGNYNQDGSLSDMDLINIPDRKHISDVTLWRDGFYPEDAEEICHHRDDFCRLCGYELQKVSANQGNRVGE